MDRCKIHFIENSQSKFLFGLEDLKQVDLE